MHEELSHTADFSLKPALDLAALQTRYVFEGDQTALTAFEEFELGQLVGAGEAARATLAYGAAAEQPPDEASRTQLKTAASDGSAALEVFFMANLGMAKQVAHRVKSEYPHTQRVELEELEQEACVELIKTIYTFVPDKKTAFSTFASDRIHNSLLQWARDKGRLLGMPEDMGDRFTAYQQRFEIGSTPVHAAASVGLPVRAIYEFEAALQRPDAVSYDLPALPGEDSTPLLELLAGADDEPPFTERVIDELSAQIAANAIKSWLIARALIATNQSGINPVRAYYMLLDRFAYGTSDTEISNKLQLSPARIKQIIGSTLKAFTTQLPPEVAAQVAAAGYPAKTNSPGNL